MLDEPTIAVMRGAYLPITFSPVRCWPVLRRLEQIEDLPINQQAVLLKTIDTFIKAAGK